MQPQELSTRRSLTLFGRTGASVDDIDQGKDRLRDLYGKNPFEDMSRLEILPKTKAEEEQDWRGEEKPLPSPSRIRINSKEDKDKPLPEYPKWGPKRKGSDPGPVAGKATLNRMF